MFLELSKKQESGKKAYLIVGDFAGVENEFNCQNNETINDFLSIKKLDGNLFYENEIYKGTKDPIGKFIQTGGEEGDIRSVIQKNLQGIPFDYGNINNVPSFLNNFILNNNSQEQLANLKKGVRLIRAMSDIPMDDIKGKEIKMLDEKQIEKIKSIDTENYNSAWEKYKTQANAKIEEVSKNAELIKKILLSLMRNKN